MKRFTRILAVLLALVLVMGSIPAEAASTSITVNSQSALNEALTSGKYTKVTLKVDDKATIKINDGKYSTIALYIKAGKATIENNAVFKSITVDDASVYTEKAVGNTIKVADKKITFNVAKGAEVKTLTLAKKNATDSVNVEGKVTTLKVSSKTTLSLVNNGTVGKLYTYKGGSVDISGASSAVTTVYVKKTSATISTDLPIKFYVYKAADITLKEGSEGTSVTGKEDDAVITVKNNSGKKVTVKEKDGSKTTVKAGESKTVGGDAASVPTTAPTPTPTAAPTATPTPTPTAAPTATPTPEVKKMVITQKELDAFTIAGDNVSSSTKASDISLSYFENGIEIAYLINVKEVKYSNGELAVKMYDDFEAGKEFFVKVGSETGSFKAASYNIEDVTRVELATAQVPVFEPTAIEFKYFDKNGIELTKKVAGSINIYNTESPFENVGDLVIKQETVDLIAFLTGDSVTFSDEGGTKLSLTLITGKDAAGKSIKVPGSGSIIAKKPQINSIVYTITKDDGVYLKSSEKNSVKHTIEIDDSTFNVFEALVYMSDGTTKTLPELYYTIESANQNKLLIVGDASSGGTLLYPLSTGSVEIAIKDENGKKINSIVLEVRGARKPQTITITSLNNKNKLNVNTVVDDKLILVATVKDQYGEVIEDPSLLVEQDERTVTSTGTVAPVSFSSGKAIIKATDVSLTGTGNAIALNITCVDNPSVKTRFDFMAKDVAYSLTEKYTEKAVVEGSKSIDTMLTLNTQENESTFVYLESSKDGFFVKEETGKLLTAAPTIKLTATDLGVASGVTVLCFTIRNGSKYISSSSSNIQIGSDNIEFIPITTGSKLPAGTYTIDFYQIKAGDSSSTITR
ncbi:MAG: hypothetical protein J6Y89_02675, partial [Lachnospiraceae bacterium]|nr:hypothetical protein [Lachnospiraceae bacterium]